MYRNAQASMNPVVQDRLQKPRSIFAPGMRIRMNVVPMFLNIFMPWGIFVLCCGTTGFSVMHRTPHFAYLALFGAFLFWVACVAGAVWARRNDPNPTWFTYVAITVGLGFVGGIACGNNIFQRFSSPYYRIKDLKVIEGIDASLTPGSNVMDGGIYVFNANNRFDASKSWHFKHGSLYCVAPIISNTSSVPLSQHYDFWAVGKDCCSEGSSDFRCGSWGAFEAQSGIRIMDDEEAAYYRLAIQQTTSLYDIMAPNPIFISWSLDAKAEVESLSQQAFKNYAVAVVFAFISSCFLVTMATCRFAWIGRAASAYETDFYNDENWRVAGYSTPIDYSVKSYTA